MTNRATPEPANPPPTTRVEIAAGGHHVAIEAAAPLNTIARKALELWQATDSASHARADIVGFTASDPAHTPLMPPEADLPYRVSTLEGADEHRRRTTHR